MGHIKRKNFYHEPAK